MIILRSRMISIVITSVQRAVHLTYVLMAYVFLSFAWKVFFEVRIGDLLLRVEKRSLREISKDIFFEFLHGLDVYEKRIEIEIEHGKHKRTPAVRKKA